MKKYVVLKVESGIMEIIKRSPIPLYDLPKNYLLIKTDMFWKVDKQVVDHNKVFSSNKTASIIEPKYQVWAIEKLKPNHIKKLKTLVIKNNVSELLDYINNLKISSIHYCCEGHLPEVIFNLNRI